MSFRSADGTQSDHTPTVLDLISNLKLSRYLMSRVCYFEAMTQLESVAVAELPQDWSVIQFRCQFPLGTEKRVLTGFVENGEAGPRGFRL